MRLSPHQVKPMGSVETPSTFIKAKIEAAPLPRVNQPLHSNHILSLTIDNHLILHFNENISARWLASLIKELC